MYSAKVSSGMTINKKTGEVKLNGLGVRVDGFSNSGLLSQALNNYNSDKSLLRHPKYPKVPGWPEETWYDLYEGMWNNLLKWKKRRTYN